MIGSNVEIREESKFYLLERGEKSNRKKWLLVATEPKLRMENGILFFLCSLSADFSFRLAHIFLHFSLFSQKKCDSMCKCVDTLKACCEYITRLANFFSFAINESRSNYQSGAAVVYMNTIKEVGKSNCKVAEFLSFHFFAVESGRRPKNQVSAAADAIKIESCK